MKWDALAITREMNASMHATIARACVCIYIYIYTRKQPWRDAGATLHSSLCLKFIVIIGLLETDSIKIDDQVISASTRESRGRVK